MSRECLFVEPKLGQWFYVLEESNAPKDAWDWREFSTAYGPFPDDTKANLDLVASRANVSGAEIIANDAYQEDPVLVGLFASAKPSGVMDRY